MKTINNNNHISTITRTPILASSDQNIKANNDYFWYEGYGLILRAYDDWSDCLGDGDYDVPHE